MEWNPHVYEILEYYHLFGQKASLKWCQMRTPWKLLRIQIFMSQSNVGILMAIDSNVDSVRTGQP